MTFKGFIDPPSPHASLQERREFRDDMLKVEPRTDDIQQRIDQAERAIRRLSGTGPGAP